MLFAHRFALFVAAVSPIGLSMAADGPCPYRCTRSASSKACVVKCHEADELASPDEESAVTTLVEDVSIEVEAPAVGQTADTEAVVEAANVKEEVDAAESELGEVETRVGDIVAADPESDADQAEDRSERTSETDATPAEDVSSATTIEVAEPVIDVEEVATPEAESLPESAVEVREELDEASETREPAAEETSLEEPAAEEEIDEESAIEEIDETLIEESTVEEPVESTLVDELAAEEETDVVPALESDLTGTPVPPTDLPAAEESRVVIEDIAETTQDAVVANGDVAEPVTEGLGIELSDGEVADESVDVDQTTGIDSAEDETIEVESQDVATSEADRVEAGETEVVDEAVTDAIVETESNETESVEIGEPVSGTELVEEPREDEPVLVIEPQQPEASITVEEEVAADDVDDSVAEETTVAATVVEETVTEPAADKDLSRVIEAWPTLDEATRLAVLDMIEDATH